MKPLRFFGLLGLVALAGCGGERTTSLFVLRAPEETGVAFRNDLVDDPAFNMVSYLYYYDGGGVAVGDVNNDGLVDLYFTASTGPNRLYLNRGGFVFEEVTDQAGVAGAAGWTKGVTMADVNADGYLDLYVSTVHYLDKQSRNALYVNNGDGTFTDRAAAYGLDHQGFSSQAAFFDYDRDGDLDLYLVNHSVHDIGALGDTTLRAERHPEAGDKLYRNDGARFTDVSAEAGIYGSFVGYGLGVAVSDLDLDGCPDLYVSNDFHENDYLYYNNCDGTFTESIYTATGHTSRSSMGNDAADFNNDGWPDVAVMDMLPDRQDILMTAAGAEDLEVAQAKLDAGYHHQYARNTLQLNRSGRRFSEIGGLAGIRATDWSWAVLFADLDNDGWKDLFVTNGIYRRPNDLDYLNYANNPAMQATLQRNPAEGMQALVDRMPQVPLPNYAFRNQGDLTFSNEAAAWGLATPGFSNGAAYADLDNDGDLDLIVNNLQATASIYENRADRQTGHHTLTVALEGTGGNTGGIGAKVIVKAGGRQQLQEAMPTRGWQSSVDPRLHFGLGTAAWVDTLVVVWPDGRAQVLAALAADTLLTLRQEEARTTYRLAPPVLPPLFTDVTAETAIPYRHRENTFIDFNRERLMPRKVSTEGPALAVGDIDGDGLDDVFAGGAKWQPARLLRGQPEGGFVATNEALWQADSLYEDVDAAFFDTDGDGDLDLYVASGGNEFWGKAEALRDRLYLNDGRGNFSRAEGALPDLFENSCCVAPADYDVDGDLDLFVGSRVVARNYGRTPPSFLLENDGTGHFVDVTDARAPALAEVGMVTGAVWAEVNRDGWPDLIVVGEWMPVRVFVGQDGGLVEGTAEAGLSRTEGWWNTVTAADFDGDGDEDLVLGNLGLNASLQAGPEMPVQLFLKDFDSDGRLDQVLTHVRAGVRYPVASPDDLIRQMPMLSRKYHAYAAFGAIRWEDLFTSEERAEAEVKEAFLFASSYAENDGTGVFTLRPLPIEAQFSPLQAVLLVDDYDRDGAFDLVLGGNFFDVTPRDGRYDASYGLLLRGDGDWGLAPVEPNMSGLVLKGQVRALRLMRGSGGARLLLSARNDDSLQVFMINDHPSEQE